jgi:hypothetical protein
MYGIDFPRAFGLASENVQKEISVGEWRRLIERGFVQAENNHFKPLIRGVPRAIDPVTNRQAVLSLASARDRWLRNASVENEGDNYENRSDRRQWTHRIKACQQAS